MLNINNPLFELVVRIELTTSSLPRKRSTPELHQQCYTGAPPQTPPLRPAISAGLATATYHICGTCPHGLRYRLMATGSCPKRAEDEVRTRDPQLGRLMLYRLSYFRDNNSIHFYKKSGNAAIAIMSQHFRPIYIWWGEMDSNHRRRAPADLQSAPFGHSGISPVFQSQSR